jgi:hypothetical protein
MLVVLRAGHGEEFGIVGEGFLERADRVDDVAERRARAAERLSSFLVGPDRGILELALYLFETLALDVEVKDTP